MDVVRRCRRTGIKGVWCTALIALVTLLSTPWMVARTAAPGPVPGQVLVKLRSPDPRQTAAVGVAGLPTGARMVRRLARTDWILVQLDPTWTVAEGVTWFRERPEVLAAVPNHRYQLHRVPNDPLQPRQDGIDPIGAPLAWDTTTGSTNVVVAVIDTGIDLTHPDLLPNLWRNPAEVAGNGVDDDLNLYRDDLHGLNVLEPTAPPLDDAGHGTHVAGIIGAGGNNTLGVAGVCWTVRLMAVRIFAADDSADTAGLVEALDYVLDQRARGVPVRVINCSWGGPFPNQALREQFDRAADLGVLCVCSAGNDHQDTDGRPQFPSGYDSPAILTVAASASCDAPASYSNFGQRTVHLAAPGSAILSTYNRGTYHELSGTSMAAPHVSGAAALLCAQRPDLTLAQLRSLLLRTTDPVSSWAGRSTSGGRLNVGRAMQVLTSGAPLPTNPPAFTAPAPRLTAASRSAAGRWANQDTTAVSLSADGRFVVFSSTASNLVAGDVGGFEDVFLLDRQSNTVVRVSQTAAGVGGNGDSSEPVISADGRTIAFASKASNLLFGDLNASSDIHVYDRVAGTWELGSKPTTSNFATGDSLRPALSADGRYLTFESDAATMTGPGTDTVGARDVFVRDRTARTTRRVSVNPSGQPAFGWSEAATISADGRQVVYHSSADDLVGTEVGYSYDVYVYDTVARTNGRISVTATGLPAGGDSVFPSISPDGRHVLFSSDADDLDGADGDASMDVFLYDRQTRTMRGLTRTVQGGECWGYALSQNGRNAVFGTDGRWPVAAGLPGVFQLYLMDLLTSRTEVVAFNDAGEPPINVSYGGVLTPDGRHVAFLSHAFNLTPGDGNAVLDAFVLDRGPHRADLSVQTADAATWIGEGRVGPRLPQRAAQTLDPGTPVVYGVTLLNSGVTTQAFVLRANPAAAGWNANAYNAAVGGTDVSSQLTTTGWTSPLLAPGASTVLRLEVLRLPDQTAEAVQEIRLTVAAAGAPDILDTVSTLTRDPQAVPGLQLVSRAADGALANRGAEQSAVSGDGRFVAFASDADNLVAGDTNLQSDVFLWERPSDAVTLVSRSGAGVQGGRDSDSPALSRDGRFLAFASDASNLVDGDTNDRKDVFVRDLTLGTIERVSLTAAGGQLSRDSESPVLSADGRWVAFASLSPGLVGNDDNGAYDIFVRDRQSSSIECVSRSNVGAVGNRESHAPQMTPDGRFILFSSLADNLAGVDANGMADVFLFDRGAGTIELISATPGGPAGDGLSQPVSLSDDGRWVTFFSSATDLGASGDPQGACFILDRQNRTLRNLTSAVTGLPAGLQARVAMVSPDGRWWAVAARGACTTADTTVSQVVLVAADSGLTLAVSATRQGTLGTEHTFMAGWSGDGGWLSVDGTAPNLLGESGVSAAQTFLYDARRLYQPDLAGRRTTATPWLGENVFRPVSQRIEQLWTAQTPVRGQLQIRNTSGNPDRIRLTAIPPEGVEVVATEASGPSNITLALLGTGWTSPVLAAGASAAISLELTGTPVAGQDRVLELSGVSATDPRWTDQLALVLLADADGDGMADGWETLQFGTTDAANAVTDHDGDGARDAAEFAAATNPKDPDSILRLLPIDRFPDGVVHLRWPARAARYYQVERADDAGAPFVPFVQWLPGQDGTLSVPDDSAPSAPQRVYRVRADPP